MALRKKRGETLTTTKVGSIGTIPGRWEATLGVTTTTTAVPLDVTPTALPAADATAAKLMESRTEQTRTDERTLIDVTAGSPSGLTLVGAEYDSLTGGTLPVTESIVAAGTLGTGLQSDGTYAEIQPLNKVWSLKTTRKATTLDAVTGQTWTTREYVSLPRMLTRFVPYVFTDRPFLLPYGDALNEDPLYISPGGNILQAGFEIELTDYSAVYDVTYVQKWKHEPFTGLSATKFLPKSIYWNTPFSSGSVPDCIHSTVTITGTTGTAHPRYAYIVWSYVFAATSPATVVGTHTITDTQERHKGGWLRTTRSITVS